MGAGGLPFVGGAVGFPFAAGAGGAGFLGGEVGLVGFLMPVSAGGADLAAGGGDLAAGTTKDSWQLGHLIFFPGAMGFAVRSVFLHLGHVSAAAINCLV